MRRAEEEVDLLFDRDCGCSRNRPEMKRSTILKGARRPTSGR